MNDDPAEVDVLYGKVQLLDNTDRLVPLLHNVMHGDMLFDGMRERDAESEGDRDIYVCVYV